MSFLGTIVVGLGGWFILSFLVVGAWMTIRSHYIRKHNREVSSPVSNEDLIFATVQEFRDGFQATI